MRSSTPSRISGFAGDSPSSISLPFLASELFPLKSLTISFLGLQFHELLSSASAVSKLLGNGLLTDGGLVLGVDFGRAGSSGGKSFGLSYPVLRWRASSISSSRLREGETDNIFSGKEIRQNLSSLKL
nr:hypothetical protein Iba_chr03cCG11920 [Ipomoea batatas]